jgi:dTDP-4-dehydrorhamnose reductase
MTGAAGIGPVMITGAAGQLGYELQRTAPHGMVLLPVDLAELDLTVADAVEAYIAAHRPAVILNAAAYTAVDKAEEQPALARLVNVTAAAHVAQSAHRHGARMVQISTDFVFGGATARPWLPSDAPAPESVYGATKRDGEKVVLDTLGSQALVLRTAWLYSEHGSNFVRTMLRLMRERDEVRVIADQIGTPTWANSLARTLWSAAARPLVYGTLHWTDAGVASWYDFAVAIQEEALQRGLLARVVPVTPIHTAAYPTPARRPAYSVLDKRDTTERLGEFPVHWRTNLRLMLDELANA